MFDGNLLGSERERARQTRREIEKEEEEDVLFAVQSFVVHERYTLCTH